MRHPDATRTGGKKQMMERKRNTTRSKKSDGAADSASKTVSATPAGAAKKGAGAAGRGTAAERHPRPVSDVAELPAGLQKLVDRLLVEGATFEDVCESVNERGAPVTLQAIQNLYRGSLDLQRRRIEYQTERARVLTEALGDPDSSDAQLAYAAMLTGLQSLTRKDAGITLKDAVKGTLERRNILLKRDLLRMRLAREEEDKRFRKTRLHAEILKMRLMRTKIAQLQRELKRQGPNAVLGPGAMEKIQEIYGLLQIPVIPRDVEPGGEKQ